MKIKVDSGGHHFFIPIPLCIVFNGMTSRIIARILKKYINFPLTMEQLDTLFLELKQAKKTFGKLQLIDVSTSNGDCIKITL